MPPSQEQLQAEFIEFQPQLKSFVYRLLTNKQDTEDISQETYVKAFNKLHQFEGRSSFKTWVFAIATNLAKDFLKTKKRWQEDYQDRCRTATYASEEIQRQMGHIAMHSQQGRFLLSEHIDYCFTCIAKVNSLEEQLCLLLKEVYNFKIKEIETITALTEGQIKYALTTARRRMQSIFEKRCSLINKNGICNQCSELNGMLNPQADFAAQEQKLAWGKAEASSDANRERLLDLRLKLVSGIDPIQGEGFELHNYMLEGIENHAENYQPS